MFKDAFERLEGEDKSALIARANAGTGTTLDAGGSKVLVHPLPFYPGQSLAMIRQENIHPPIERNFVYGRDAVVLLDWTNAPIYALNARVPLTLADETLADYVRFFFSFVRGPEGRFLVVESVDDMPWREEPSPAGRKALARMVEPVRFKNYEDDGAALLSLTFVFKGALFAAEARVAKEGHITLGREEILVEDIPVTDDLLAG